MALTFTGTGGLFTRLGRIAKIADVLRTNQSALETNLEAIRTACLAGAGITEPLSNFDRLIQASIAQAQGYMPNLQTLAQAILIKMVYDDNPAQASSLVNALREVIRQMQAASQTVKRCTPTLTLTADSNNAGDGVMYGTVHQWDGTLLEWIYPESAIQIRCTTDSQTGGATEGRETFSYVGEPFSVIGLNSVWNYDYPLGSGRQTRLIAVSPTSGSYLRADGDFDNFVTTGAQGPEGWTVITGTNPTNFTRDTTTFYSGTASLRLNAGSTLQAFSYKPATALPPTSVLGLNVRLRASAALTGNLRISITNPAGTTLTGGDGNPMQIDIALSTVSTSSWGSHGGYFYSPRSVPSGALVRVEVTTAISGGNLNVDRMTLFELTELYAGGPRVAVVSGANKFVVNDLFFLTTTNDFASSTNLATWQWAWERLFTPTPRSLGLYLPSTTGTPTISDTLITA